jgi:hypothetical protein
MKQSILLIALLTLAGCGSSEYSPVATTDIEIMVFDKKMTKDACMDEALMLEDKFKAAGENTAKVRCGIVKQKIRRQVDTLDYNYRYRWIGYNVIFKEVNDNECRQMKQAFKEVGDMGDTINCASSFQLIN